MSCLACYTLTQGTKAIPATLAVGAFWFSYIAIEGCYGLVVLRTCAYIFLRPYRRAPNIHIIHSCVVLEFGFVVLIVPRRGWCAPVLAEIRRDSRARKKGFIVDEACRKPVYLAVWGKLRVGLLPEDFRLSPGLPRTGYLYAAFVFVPPFRAALLA